MRLKERIVVIILVTAAFSLMFFKIMSQGFSLNEVIPRRSYELSLTMELDGHGAPVAVRTALPVSIERQEVMNELFSSGDFAFRIDRDNGSRTGVWEAETVTGPHTVVYSFGVAVEAREYAFEPDLRIPATYPAEFARYLLPTDTIQSDNKEITACLASRVPEGTDDIALVLRRIFDYAAVTIRPAPFKGLTDALTCLRLGEGSCGGKARLMAALLRAARIPARLVGGVILKNGTWRESHVWVEALVAGRWVPFCPLNGYFAMVPASYLELYRGEKPLFTHTADINFTYGFHAREVLIPPAQDRSLRPAGMLNLWAMFEAVRIPVNLLKIILMIPFGALVVVVARNIVGIRTFGTFMPVLIAVAFRDTGLPWGLVLFSVILGLGALVRWGLQSLQLLHTPRLGILMTVTVLFMFLITAAGVATGSVLPTRVTLFPIVILTLTVERFALTIEEDGWPAAVKIVAGTLVAIAAAFGVMNWTVLELMTLTFPEVLILVVALFIIIGRWKGMRFMEYIRFRLLIAGKVTL